MPPIVRIIGIARRRVDRRTIDVVLVVVRSPPLPPPSSTIHPPTTSARAIPTWLKFNEITLLVACSPGGNHVVLRRGEQDVQSGEVQRRHLPIPFRQQRPARLHRPRNVRGVSTSIVDNIDYGKC